MNIDSISRVDKEDMYAAIWRFPEQLQAGRLRAEQQEDQVKELQGQRYNGVVVAGMGGSAISGDFLRTLAIDQAQVPIVVNRGYQLPSWVDSDTLVIASSYSGNTEETLSAFDIATSRGATLLCIHTGGTLHARAEAAGIPVVTVQPGLQPRAALSYAATAIVTICSALGLVDVARSDWDEAISVLQSLRAKWGDPAVKDNPAIALAGRFTRLFPVIYSSEQLEVVNLRWRNQLHENAKVFAVGNLLPEMNHNEIMGWSRFGAELHHLGVILLRDKEDHPRTQRRLEVTASLLKQHAGHWEEIQSIGVSRLARLLSLMYMSDWVSFYLAIYHKVDPSPVGLISVLKKRLADSTSK